MVEGGGLGLSAVADGLLPVAFGGSFNAAVVAALAARGHPPDADPDALIDPEVVRLVSGSMLLAVLEEDGIDVVGIESFDVAARDAMADASHGPAA